MKTVIVGCGRMAGIHIQYILKTEGVQLVALCDQNEIRAKELAQRYGLPYYTNLAQMLAETRPEAVHVLTPPQNHAASTIQALEAGCHVLSEKPLCLSCEEAEAIYAAAKSAGRQVSIDHTLLWSPLVQKARQEVNSGRLGRVLHIQYVIGDDYLDALKGGCARWALELRGGVFCDLISHPLSLIHTFLPEAEVVSARACGTGIKDLLELWVDFVARGAGASLWMSMNQYPLEHNLRIYCTNGTIHVDLRNFCLAVVPERGLPGPMARVVNTFSEVWQRVGMLTWNVLKLPMGRFDPYVGTAGAIQAFYQAINQGKPSPVSEEEARAVVQLSTEVWDSLERAPGALRPALDEKGRVIVHKTTEDFVRKHKDKQPSVLVTGGTGFIGHHLVQQLVSEGQRVRVFCRATSNLDVLPVDGVELAFGDLSDIDSVHRAMQGIEVVYHLAATMNGDWATQYEGTAVGTQNVLEAAAEANIRKVVHVSSIGVLHASRFPNNGLIDENFPLEQLPKERGYYSRAKLEAEELVRKFIGDGLPVCIIRPGLVYGPGRKEFLSDAGFRVSNSLTLVVGLGGRRLGLTYVENLVDALVLAARTRNSCGKTYHIVDPDQPTVRQYIQAYQLVTRKRSIVLYIPTILWTLGFSLLDRLLQAVQGKSPKLGYRLHSIAWGPRYDTSTALRDFGWKPEIGFEDAMRRTFPEV